MRSVMTAIITNQALIKEAKEAVDSNKTSLKSRMCDFIHKRKGIKVWKLIFKDKIFSISDPSPSKTQKFDEEKFKEDYPDLYKKYCYNHYTPGVGGTLTVRSLTKRQQEAVNEITKGCESNGKFNPEK